MILLRIFLDIFLLDFFFTIYFYICTQLCTYIYKCMYIHMYCAVALRPIAIVFNQVGLERLMGDPRVISLLSLILYLSCSWFGGECYFWCLASSYTCIYIYYIHIHIIVVDRVSVAAEQKTEKYNSSIYNVSWRSFSKILCV